LAGRGPRGVRGGDREDIDAAGAGGWRTAQFAGGGGEGHAFGQAGDRAQRRRGGQARAGGDVERAGFAHGEGGGRGAGEGGRGDDVHGEGLRENEDARQRAVDGKAERADAQGR